MLFKHYAKLIYSNVTARVKCCEIFPSPNHVLLQESWNGKVFPLGRKVKIILLAELLISH